MNVTRRDFARLALAGVPALAGFSSLGGFGSSALAQTAARNRSYVNGVQFGIQPFCYHDLAMTRENRGTLTAEPSGRLLPEHQKRIRLGGD